MYFTHAIAVLALFAVQDTWMEGPGEITSAHQEPTKGSSSLLEKEAPEKEPMQLAQYPGAPMEDSHGNLWFSTVTEGIIRYDGKQFVNFTTKDGLASDLVRDIVIGDNGSLWIATDGGVSIYDGKSFTTLTDYGELAVTHTFGELGDHRDIWDILRDRHGTWWIATLNGVFRYDGAAFVAFPLPVVAAKGKYEFSAKMVYSILEDTNGDLWFSTDGAGAVRFDGTDMVVYTEQSHGLCSDRICNILKDSRGLYWFGSSGGGVSRYDGKTFTTHLRSSTFSKYTGWGRYMGIFEDRSGHVWFGVSSMGGGVHRYDGKDFLFFSEKEGLGTGGVSSIWEDRSGILWLGTTAGVYRYDGKKFVNFTREK